MDAKSISESIEEIVTSRIAEGAEYVTVRTLSKELKIKQAEVESNLPDTLRFEVSASGSLGEYKIKLATGETAMSSEIGQEVMEQPVEEMAPAGAPAATVTEPKPAKAPKPVKEPVEPGEEKLVCRVCGNKLRKNEGAVRGICPLCWRQLVKDTGIKSTTLEAMSEEEFTSTLDDVVLRRQALEEYKESRFLTEEQFAGMADNLIPVKEVFAAAKEAGYGPGRTAQAMGGDRFRHEPLGGFGSVWTPYFRGGRKSWYFDRDILNNLDDLKKPERKTATKSKTDSNGNPMGRGGSRGAAMKPVGANGQAAQAVMQAPQTDIEPEESEDMPF